MAFVSGELKLSAKQQDGATLRDHLNSAWRQSGRKPQQLEDCPELPPLAAHLWGYFVGLCGERGNNGMAESRITAQNVKDWMWFNGVKHLELWEKKALRAADNVWMQQQNSETPKKSKK